VRSRSRENKKYKKRSRSDSRNKSSNVKHESRESSNSPEKTEVHLTGVEEARRQKMISDIESENFVQQSFRSETRSVTIKADNNDEVEEEIMQKWGRHNPHEVASDESSDSSTSEDEEETFGKVLKDENHTFGKPLQQSDDEQMYDPEVESNQIEQEFEEKRKIIAEIARNWDNRVEESKRKHKSLAMIIEAKEEEKQRKQELNMKKWSRAYEPSAPTSSSISVDQDNSDNNQVDSWRERWLENQKASEVYKSSKLLSKTKAKIKQIEQEKARQLEEEAERLAEEEQEQPKKEESNEIIGSIHEYANLMGKSVKQLAAAKYEPPEVSSSEESDQEDDGNLWGAILGSSNS